MGPGDSGAFAEWDKWVADRIAQRTAATADVMKEAGLTSPLPGLAGMKGQGTFFACAPYGTCWEPATTDDPQQSADKVSQSRPSSAASWGQPAHLVQANFVASLTFRAAQLMPMGPPAPFDLVVLGRLLSLFSLRRSLPGAKGSDYRQGKGGQFRARREPRPLGLGRMSRRGLDLQAASLCVVCRCQETSS